MLALVGAALLILLQFNFYAIVLGLASAAPIAIYPFMKRITYWPQLFLGIAFNWGALLGWAAVTGSLAWPPILLYAGGIAWTLAYDTIYAHQDKEDDLLIGIKSTALKFGAATPRWLALFFAVALLLIGLAGWLAGAGVLFTIGIVAAAFHAIWQLRQLDIADPGRCLMLFRSNRDFGLIIFAGAVLDSLTRRWWDSMIDRMADAAGKLLALAKEAGADAADVLAVAGEAIDVELRDGVTEKLERSEDRDFGLRVLVGQSQAVVSTSRDDAASLRTAAERAVAMAKAAPQTISPAWPRATASR